MILYDRPGFWEDLATIDGEKIKLKPKEYETKNDKEMKKADQTQPLEDLNLLTKKFLRLFQKTKRKDNEEIVSRLAKTLDRNVYVLEMN